MLENPLSFVLLGVAGLLLIGPQVWPLVGKLLGNLKGRGATQTAKPEANAVAEAYRLIEPWLDQATAKSVRGQIADGLLPVAEAAKTPKPEAVPCV